MKGRFLHDWDSIHLSIHTLATVLQLQMSHCCTKWFILGLAVNWIKSPRKLHSPTNCSKNIIHYINTHTLMCSAHTRLQIYVAWNKPCQKQLVLIYKCCLQHIVFFTECATNVSLCTNWNNYCRHNISNSWYSKLLHNVLH